VKKYLNTGKVGHTGTLDKFATGLLVVPFGPFTKFAQQITDSHKSYQAVIEFGKTTDSLDPEGNVTEKGPIPELAVLENCLKMFRGRIMQRPPRFSAIKLGGRRASDRVRNGEDVEIPARPVDISQLTLTSYEPPFATMDIQCSKGTYIRSLARDIAECAGSKSYVKELRRTAVGQFSIDNAFDPDNLSEDALILPMEFFTKYFPAEIGFAADDFCVRLRQGTELRGAWYKNIYTNSHLSDPMNALKKDDMIAIFDKESNLAACVQQIDGEWRYRLVIP
jgi:tRNA pseudouridine55 synthase